MANTQNDAQREAVKHIKFTTPEQQAALIATAMSEASEEAGFPMMVASVRQTHTPPAKAGDPDVYELWVTLKPRPADPDPVVVPNPR